jgi:hypothetical protein
MSEKWPKTISYYDHKDPSHPMYKHTQWQQEKHHDLWAVDQHLWADDQSKDRANLEALEDHALITPSTARDIPSNTPPKALPLDATAREDTMREDAPLATSHNMSLSPPRSDTTMPGGLD